MDLLSSILADKELTAYLQFMLEENCDINGQVQLDLGRYKNGSIERADLFSNLEAETRFQMGGKEYANKR